MKWLRAALCLAGLAVSFYLTLVHYDTAVPLACSSTGLIDCAQVVTSPESVWLGLPVAAWGLLWFGVMTVLSAVRQSAAALRAARLWAMVGAAVVVYLVYAELVVIGAVCMWCTAVHVLVLSLLALYVLSPPSQTA